MEMSYFSMTQKSRDFMAAFARKLAEANRLGSQNLITKENIYRLRHGRDWGFIHATPDAFDGKIKVHSSEVITDLEDIADHRIESLSVALSSVTSDMNLQFAKNLYETVSDVCESKGNTVSAADTPSLAEAFYAAIEKIEFTADKFGEVHLPTIHASPGTVEKMHAELEASTEDFKKRFEEMKENKIKEAQRKEAERKSRFLSYGGEQ